MVKALPPVKPRPLLALLVMVTFCAAVAVMRSNWPPLIVTGLAKAVVLDNARMPLRTVVGPV